MAEKFERTRALDTLFDEAPCGLLVLGADGTILAVNQTFLQWTGYERGELVGTRRFDELLTAPYRIYYETHYGPLLRLQGFVNEIALDFAHRQRRSLPTFVNAVEQRARDGSVEFIRVAVLAATDRRAYERELLLARRESEEAVKAKADFLAMFAHEIRNPLAAVMMEMELAERATPEATADRVTRMRGSLDRVLTLLNNMLDISRLEAGKMRLEETDVELADVVQTVAHTMGPLAANKHLPLVIAVDHALPKRLRGDPFKLGQVLVNLVANAIKFTEHGSITIGASPVSESRDRMNVRFWVEDTGVGIAVERQALIFEEYTQADPSIVRQFGGTGLGLAISAKLVALQGGRLCLDSQPGRGSMFSFEIPLRRSG